MSINRLKGYLKNNHQEIVDYWVENTKLCYIRVIQTNSFITYFINVESFSIHIENPSEINNIHFMKKIGRYEEDYSEKLIVFYEMMQNLFPQHSTRTFLYYRKYIIENRDTIYKIIHSETSFCPLFVYPIFSLEWYYEHNKEIDLFINTFTSDIVQKTNEIYSDFLHNFENFFQTSNEHLQLFQNVHSKISEKSLSLQKYISLYIQIYLQEKVFVEQIREFEDYSNAYTLHDTTQKMQKKVMIKKKYSELQVLKLNIKQKILEIYNDIYYYRLYFIYFLNEIKLSLSRFQSLMIDFTSEFK